MPAATVSLPQGGNLDGEMFLLNTPGKLAALHPCQGVPLAYFVFWHPPIPGFDYTDLDQHKRILETAFTGIGWRVPEFLDAVRGASDMYFDSVARVDVPTWSRGRVALLGDASSCVSLFGDGSTLAIAGAYELAKARLALTQGLETDDLLLCSAKTGAGLKELWTAIHAAATS